MTAENSTALEEKLRPLRERYVQQLPDNISMLKGYLAPLENNSLSEDNRAELKSKAHKLAGSGATYGFSEISVTARALEAELLQPHSDAEKTLSLLNALIAACEAARKSYSEAASQAQHQTPETSPENPLPLLLTVDDDPFVTTLLISLFSSSARVIAGQSTAEALHLMRKYHPALVILDDMMPGGISGLKLVENIRHMPDISDIPVVMLTASDRPEEMMRGLIAGAVDYVTKPFDPDKLSAKINSLLKHSASNVLIAHNDEAVRGLIAHKFRKMGYKVLQACNGKEALDATQEHSFSFIILDKDIKSIPASEVLDILQMNLETSDIPVIMLGSDAQTPSHKKVSYLQKPFEIEGLVSLCSL